jgi:hypothetical protein
MKILVIAQEVLRKALVVAIKSIEDEAEVIEVDHNNGLEVFLTEEPNVVIIADYNEGGSGTEVWGAGLQTYQDIKNSATNEVVVRCGFAKYEYPDYIQAPFKIEELIKLLKQL